MYIDIYTVVPGTIHYSSVMQTKISGMVDFSIGTSFNA